MMTRVPDKTCLVTSSWVFLLHQIRVGLAETDPPEPDAVFTHTPEALFENSFTGLEKTRLFLLV